MDLKAARIAHAHFARALPRDERKVVGPCDSTITAHDPFPDRDLFEGGDPTLFAPDRVSSFGVNTLIREQLGVETDLDYHLLSLKANESWKVDVRKHDFEANVGATDDLRYAMALNPHMKVTITHRFQDLVTPWFALNRLVGLMKLAPGTGTAPRSGVHRQRIDAGDRAAPGLRREGVKSPDDT